MILKVVLAVKTVLFMSALLGKIPNVTFISVMIDPGLEKRKSHTEPERKSGITQVCQMFLQKLIYSTM